jgi:hypothetical protein
MQLKLVVSFQFLLFYFTGEPFATMLAGIALFGIFAEIVRSRFFLLVWLILILILSVRTGSTFATIPVSMLFGSGVVWVLVPGLLSFAKRVPEDTQPLPEILHEGITKLVLSVLLIYVLFSAMVLPYLGWAETRTLSQYEHQAMEWVSQNTSSDSKFVVLTGEQQRYELDPISEWFPAISKRISVSTVQGGEWLPDQQFKKQIERYKLLQSCV